MDFQFYSLVATGATMQLVWVGNYAASTWDEIRKYLESSKITQPTAPSGTQSVGQLALIDDGKALVVPGFNQPLTAYDLFVSGSGVLGLTLLMNPKTRLMSVIFLGYSGFEASRLEKKGLIGAIAGTVAFAITNPTLALKAERLLLVLGLVQQEGNRRSDQNLGNSRGRDCYHVWNHCGISYRSCV
jgi:hypothetical protein